MSASFWSAAALCRFFPRPKRQRTGALQDAPARFGRCTPKQFPLDNLCPTATIKLRA